MEYVDNINPSHYVTDKSKVQPIDIIEMFGLNFARGNVIKYVLRAGRKKEAGYKSNVKEIEDLKKAKWYLEREIQRMEKWEIAPMGDGNNE